MKICLDGSYAWDGPVVLTEDVEGNPRTKPFRAMEAIETLSIALGRVEMRSIRARMRNDRLETDALVAAAVTIRQALSGLQADMDDLLVASRARYKVRQ